MKISGILVGIIMGVIIAIAAFQAHSLITYKRQITLNTLNIQQLANHVNGSVVPTVTVVEPTEEE